MESLATIKSLGLTDQEAEIYLSLLKLGGSQASTVAKTIGIKRTTIYPIFKHLAEKGFVTVYFKKNRRYYYAQKPQRVASLFSKKLDNFSSIIPQLQSMEKKEAQMAGLRFIETLEELKQFYIGILDEYKNKEYDIIGSANNWENLDNEWFIQFRKDRSKNNIKTKLLLAPGSEAVNPTDKKLLRDFRYLPKKYRFKSTMDIFADKILIISPELATLAVVIEIPAMRDLFKSMFEMLWDNYGEEVLKK